MIVVIDVAKDNHHAFLGTATGKTLLKRLVFHNNFQGYEKLFTYVEATKVKNNLGLVLTSPTIIFWVLITISATALHALRERLSAATVAAGRRSHKGYTRRMAEVRTKPECLFSVL